METKDHWEKVYATKAATEVSWFQPHAQLSLKLIHDAGVPASAAIIDVGQQDLEFVTTKPADLAVLVDNLTQPLGDLLEQRIAHRMAQGVVDRLEPVEIKHEKRTAALGGAISRQHRGEALVHRMAV